MAKKLQLFPQRPYLYQSPKDNFEQIVASSRAKYARNREVVEAEIRDTIEQSEKYKKELSDSGRAAGSAGANYSQAGNYEQAGFSHQTGNYTSNNSSHSQVNSRANFTYVPTPQSDFRKLKMSPNAAEGKQRLGLKDLSTLIAGNEASTANTPQSESPSQTGNQTPSEPTPNTNKSHNTRKPSRNRRFNRNKSKPQPQSQS